MFPTTYTPTDMEGSDSDLCDLFETMFNDLQDSTSPQAEELFNRSVSNYDIPVNAAHGVGARQNLRAMVDCAYSLADEVGESSVKKMEKTIKEYSAWCSEQLAGREAPMNDKRKYVSMSQTTYRGGNKRVYNTHHMP